MLLPSEAASLGQPSSSSSWLAQDSRASSTDNNSLGMAEHSGDPKQKDQLHQIKFNNEPEKCKIFLVQFALVFSGFIGALQITITTGNHHLKL